MGVSTIPAQGFQPGDVKPSASVLAQSGWLLCDGLPYLRADYPALFAALGGAASTWGLPDGTHFNVPNLKGKVIVGVDATQTEFDVLGDTGGSKTSTAPHTHSLSAHTHTLGSHTHTYSHTHTTDAPGVSHSHYVNGNNFSTGFMSVNWNHFHTAQFVRVVYQTANATHAHAGGANTGSEGVSGGIYYGANWSIDVAGTDVNHQHNANHDHSTDTQAPTHSHSTTTQTGTVSSGPTGGSDTPSIDATGASTAGVASGNLQPFTVMNYFIKT